MAGAAPTPSGKGGRKSLDASINLVPFIDLLSCCISFLLITAVWSQMVALQTNQQAPTNQREAKEDLSKTTLLTVLVDKEKLVLKEEQEGMVERQEIANKNGKYNWSALLEKTTAWRSKYPTVSRIILRPHDEVSYDDVVAAMNHIPFFDPKSKEPPERNGFSIQLVDLYTKRTPPSGGAK